MLFNGSPRLKKGLSWLAVWLLLVSGVAALNVTIKGKMGQSSFDEPVRYAYVELWEAKVSGDVFHQSSFTNEIGGAAPYDPLPPRSSSSPFGA